MLPLEISVEVISILLSFKVDDKGKISALLDEIINLLNKVPFFLWDVYACVSWMALAFFIYLKRNNIDRNVIKKFIKVSTRIREILKHLGYVKSRSLRKFFSGLEFLATNNKKKAFRKFVEGIDSGSEDILTQYFLTVGINETGNKQPQSTPDLKISEKNNKSLVENNKNFVDKIISFFLK
jgi:hypothetical protein